MIKLTYWQFLYLTTGSEITKVAALIWIAVIIFRDKRWRWLPVWLFLVGLYAYVIYSLLTVDTSPLPVWEFHG